MDLKICLESFDLESMMCTVVENSIEVTFAVKYCSLELSRDLKEGRKHISNFPRHLLREIEFVAKALASEIVC